MNIASKYPILSRHVFNDSSKHQVAKFENQPCGIEREMYLQLNAQLPKHSQKGGKHE